MEPGQYNFDLLYQIYGTAGNRRNRSLKKKKKKTSQLRLPPNFNATDTPSASQEQVKDDREIKEPSKKELRLYTDFVTALETITCDDWNDRNPKKFEATKVESNERVEVCELEFGEDHFVQVRKLIWFEGWEKDDGK